MSITVDRDQAFLTAVIRIADEIAAAHSYDVDKNARFPSEAVDALREERALSALVPTELGGEGVSFEAVAGACFELGRRCGATGMVFAMHQIQVACIVRHFDGSAWFEDYLRDLAAEQRLIASATSEVGTGGDLGRSIAAVTPHERGVCTFEKQGPTVSYGAYADDLLTTLRRSPDADGSDQVLVLTRKEQAVLEQTASWDPLGMRGTCSPGFIVRAEFLADQALPAPFAVIGAQTMVPVTHVLWSHVWLGIATDAFDRARAFARASAKQKPGQPSAAATRLSHLLTQLSFLRAEVTSALNEFVSASEDYERLGTLASGLRFNSLKIAASEQTPKVCQGALEICGIVGYKNDTPFSIGRHLRDALSAPLMIANERIHQSNASILLVAKDV